MTHCHPRLLLTSVATARSSWRTPTMPVRGTHSTTRGMRVVDRWLCWRRPSTPGTVARLEKLGVREGWHCLEVGAGRSSIADWLCRRVGPQGHVLATDLDVRFVEAGVPHTNLEVRRHDIRFDPLPGTPST